MIDDSSFERAEVESALPQVRVYSERDIDGLLARPAFDVPQSSTSAGRRFQYLANMRRHQAQEGHGDDYEEFLRSCSMQMCLFKPTEPDVIERCLELISRSNQQNLSGRRYTADEFRTLLSTSGILGIAIHCQDRFGDYGIVGYASVDERPEIPVVIDFVLSCRVVLKKVEHRFFQWLAEHERGNGYRCIDALLVRTQKNTLMSHLFDEGPFECVAEENGRFRMRLRVGQPVVDATIISLESRM